MTGCSHPRTVTHPNLDTVPGLPHQGVPEDPAHPVVPKDVVLEVDVIAGEIDGFDPGVEGVGPVELKANGVPVHPDSAGGSMQGPLRDLFGESRIGLGIRTGL